MDKVLYFILGFGLGLLMKAAYNTCTLNKILNIVTMSQENLDLLMGKVNGLEVRLDNVKGDITRIKESLPAGAMTAEEVAALSTRLDEVLAKATALDQENEPEAPAPTE